MAFVPLFCQSHYSPAGVASCSEMVRRARSLGYVSLGLCDWATTAGFQEFDDACKANGLRPVFGCRLELEGFIDGERAYPLDFLIESEQGHRHLVRLLTRWHDLREKEPGPVRRIGLKESAAGLQVILPPDGELAFHVRRRDRQATEKCLAAAYETFGAALVIGVDDFEEDRAPAPPAEEGAPPAAPGTGATLRRLADFAGVPCVAAPRFLCPEPADAPALVFLEHPQGAPGSGWEPPPGDVHPAVLVSEQDLLARFPPGDGAPHEAGELARRCAWRPSPNKRIFPVQDFERGFDANSFLFDLAIQGAAERYGAITEEVKQRLNREFEEIKNRNLSPYLLLHRQIADHLDAAKIPRGAGRGPIVAGVFAHCLGLTRIDPLQYRLAPQPLASENETHPPIRLEIPGSAVPKVIEWLRSAFGEQHVARIGRRPEIRRDALIAEIAQWAGMTEEEKKVALREKARRRGAGPAQRLAEQDDARRWRSWRDPALAGDMADRLAPRPRGLTSAPGKWVLSAEPLEYVIPCVRTSRGERVTDPGEAAIDRLGAPRIEFSPHLLMDLLDRARAGAQQSTPGLNLKNIPLDDRTTFDLLARGDTLGIPPLDQITVKALLRKNRPASPLQLLKTKTDAGRNRRTAEQKPVELGEVLPDVLLAYQLAYFKAHHPAAYYAAALACKAEAGEDASGLVRAIRRAGIEILPPDINLGGPHSAIFGGKIRLGLLVVRHMNERAVEEILQARLGGTFARLGDLLEALSPRAVSPRALQSLIAAGALDGFGLSRGQMSAAVAAVYKKPKPGAAAESRDAGQNTLFDLSTLEDTLSGTNPDPALAPKEWDPAAIRRREREALGFNPGGDPLSVFPRTLEALRPLPPDEITPRLGGRLVRTAGLVLGCDDEGPLVAGDGSRLLDLEGLPVHLNPTLSHLARRAAAPGEAVLVMGVVNHREGYTRLDAEGVWRLADLEEQGTRVGRVRLGLAGENRTTLRHLNALAKQFPGTARIELKDYPGYRGLLHRWLERRHVFFCSPFYQGLAKILALDNVELFAESGEPLEIALARVGEEG